MQRSSGWPVQVWLMRKNPLVVFFFGPTGVGKTELARQLALELGIGFARFDMSEYMERHTVSSLSAPLGYVGFDEGGLLTDTVTGALTAFCS